MACHRKLRILDEMKPDAGQRRLFKKVSRHRIADHGLEFRDRVALGRDASPGRIIPTCDIPAGFEASIDVESDRFHIATLREI